MQNHTCARRGPRRSGKGKARYLLPVFIAAALYTPAQAQPQFVKPELQTWATEIYHVPIRAAGGATVQVWKSTDGKFYLKPYLAIDWNAVSLDIASKCDDSSDPETIATIEFPVELDSMMVRQEVVAYASASGGDLQKLKLSELRAFPFVTLAIATGDSLDESIPPKLRRRFPLGSITVQGLATSLNTDFLETQRIRVIDTCAELRRMLATRGIQAEAYVTYDDVKARFVFASLQDVIHSKALLDLLYEEKATGKKTIVWESKSKRRGINIPPFSDSKSKAKGKSEAIDTRHRAVSNSLLSDTLRDAASEMHVRQVTETGAAAMSIDQLQGIIEAFVRKRAEQITATFDRREDGSWAIVAKGVDRPLDRKEVEDLIATKSEQEDVNKTAQEASYEGAATKDAREQMGKLISDIRWEQKGAEYVPVSVTLHDVALADLTVANDLRWDDFALADGNGQARIPISHFDLQRSEHRRGWEDARRELMPPPKHVIVLPPKFRADHPKPPSRRQVLCDDIARARELAEPLKEMRKYAGDFAGYAGQLGCTVDPPDDAKRRCLASESCVMLRTGTNCLYSVKWEVWYDRFLTRNALHDDWGNDCREPAEGGARMLRRGRS